jgi:cyanate lyase
MLKQAAQTLRLSRSWAGGRLPAGQSNASAAALSSRGATGTRLARSPTLTEFTIGPGEGWTGGRPLDRKSPDDAQRDQNMRRVDLTEKILDVKREKGWSWRQVCDAIGGMSDVLIVGALLGQMKLVKPQARRAAELFGLSASEEALLNEVPYRGTGTPMPPTDPLIYRFYEMVMVNGPAWKALIEEEFGDGIMSAIDFDIAIERQPNPKGDRVKITMSGKFLPYKYYGNQQGVPEYGYKEG